MRTSPYLAIDATAGVTHQDHRLAERIGASGCPTVVVLNKWELVATEDRTDVLVDIGDRLAFLGEAPVLKVSAFTGLGVHHILPAVAAAEEAYQRGFPPVSSTGLSDRFRPHILPVGARIQYAVQGRATRRRSPCSPTGGSQPTYLRYVERGLRERFDFGPNADQAEGEGQREVMGAGGGAGETVRWRGELGVTSRYGHRQWIRRLRGGEFGARCDSMRRAHRTRTRSPKTGICPTCGADTPRAPAVSVVFQVHARGQCHLPGLSRLSRRHLGGSPHLNTTLPDGQITERDKPLGTYSSRRTLGRGSLC